jgi:hypothetical protein
LALQRETGWHFDLKFPIKNESLKSIKLPPNEKIGITGFRVRD